MHFQAVETQALSTRGQADVNLHRPNLGSRTGSSPLQVALSSVVRHPRRVARCRHAIPVQGRLLLLPGGSGAPGGHSLQWRENDAGGGAVGPWRSVLLRGLDAVEHRRVGCGWVGRVRAFNVSLALVSLYINL